jgi:hypothetical protein
VVIVSLILLSELSARTAGGAIAGLRAARRHPLDDRHLGNIADIRYQRGDYDEATAPQTKRLRANEDLGDLDGLKAAKWEPARIDLAQKKYEAASRDSLSKRSSGVLSTRCGQRTNRYPSRR